MKWKDRGARVWKAPGWLGIDPIIPKLFRLLANSMALAEMQVMAVVANRLSVLTELLTVDRLMNGWMVLRTRTPVLLGTFVAVSTLSVVVASLICLLLLLTTMWIPAQFTLLINALILLCIPGPIIIMTLSM